MQIGVFPQCETAVDVGEIKTYAKVLRLRATTMILPQRQTVLIRKRTLAGLKAARARRRKGGRPRKRC
jgi:DNA invertase Pin-like site-specific DNA recombinase